MSNNNTEDSPFAGLDSLNLGPAWAKDKDQPSKDKYKNYETTEEGGNGRRDKRRSSGPRDGQRPQNRDRNERRGGGKFNNQGRRDRRPPRVEAPDYIEGSVMPVEASLDNLANEIKGSARSYLVFDLARTVLKERNRFRINFKSKDKEKKLFRVRKDNSLWLSREEAFKHILSDEELLGAYYKKFKKEVEAPSGNYTAVARCGFSGVLLGPPNFHGYQQAVAKLHREQFSNLSLEAYKKRIKTERDEEAVAQWLEESKVLSVYVPLSELPAVEEVAAPEEEVVTEGIANEETSEVTNGAEAVEDTAVEETAPDVAEAPAEEVAVEIPEGATELETAQAVERHFLENYYKAAVEESAKSWVLGDVEGKKLSPALLALLKTVVSEERRFPGKLSAVLCRQMSGRHIAVYKWEGKLRAGPARPKAVPTNVSLSERIETLLSWISNNSGEGIKAMWAGVLSEDATEEVKHQWYADLHWLINQGYMIFTADGHVHLAKELAKPEAVSEETSTPSEDVVAEASPSKPVEAEESVEETAVEATSEEVENDVDEKA